MSNTRNIFSFMFRRRYGQRYFAELKVGQYYWFHGERYMKLTKDTGLRMADRKILEFPAVTITITRRN